MPKLTYNTFVQLKDFTIPATDKKSWTQTTVIENVVFFDSKKGLKSGYATRYNINTNNHLKIKKDEVVYTAYDGHERLNNVTHILVPLYPLPKEVKEPVKEPVKPNA